MPEEWNSLKLIRWTSGYFEKAGIPNPRLDAELLLTHLLKCNRIDLYTRHEAIFKEKHLADFKELIRRRVQREPLQYITGETGFYGLKFRVTPEVLIPRPETELLAEEALRIWQGCLSEDPRRKLSQGRPSAASGAGRTEGAGGGEPTAGSVEGAGDKHPCQILDIGTGSGCIAITLAKHLSGARIVATDISKETLEIARENAKRHEVIDRIEFILADIAPWKRFTAEGRSFNLIVSNPPYIATGEFPSLQPEVRDFEPRRALDGGEDGLRIIRQILAETPPFLKEGGLLLMEIGEDQGPAIRNHMQSDTKIHLKEILKDLSGHDRILVARK